MPFVSNLYHGRSLTGAWIETLHRGIVQFLAGRSLTGAWIETTSLLDSFIMNASLPYGGVD